MIDFHCHVDLYPNPSAVVAEVVRRKCYVLAVTTTPLAWAGTRRVVDNAPRVRVGLGLHPELVSKRAHEVELLCKLVANAKFIGEVGLDGSPPHRASLPLQRDVFRTILTAVTIAGGRVMSIHSRGAATETLDDIAKHAGPSTPVLHWFSGTQRELSRAIEMGCWFSVGPAMVRGEKGRKLVKHLPEERVLTETDGPFARNGQIPLYPWDTSIAEVALGHIWRTDTSEIRERLRNNLRKLMQMSNTE